MASIVRIKRSAVQGKAPTTSEILAGELALNTRDGKLFSSDGATVFEIGANVHSLSVGSGGLAIANGSITFPTSDGNDGQVLTTNGSGQLTFSDVSQDENSQFSRFEYKPTTTGTALSGNDRNGRSLSYSPNNLSVYLNGINLSANSDYIATDSSSVVLTEAYAANDLISIYSYNPVTNFVSSTASQTANTKVSSSASEVVVDSFAVASYRSAKYMVQVDNTDHLNQFQTSEVLLVHNGSATFITEYGQIATSSVIATVDSDINSGMVRLKVTPTVTNSNIKITRLAVIV